MSERIKAFSDQLLASRIEVTDVVTDQTLQQGVQWQMLRFDRLAGKLSGNKAFKLLPWLQQAEMQGITHLISFGGMFSNHLHALAAAGQRFGLHTTGIVRGYVEQPLSQTLVEAEQMGMHLQFVDRKTYACRYDQAYLAQLQRQYPDALIIPEGGSGSTGESGAGLMMEMLLKSLDYEPDIVALASGTGASFLGLLASAQRPEQSEVIAVPALKNAEQIVEAARASAAVNWQVLEGYDFGGFAAMNRELACFINDFQRRQKIPLDPVYTAKLCYAVDDRIAAGVIKPGSRVVTLHTGGVQGMRGMQAGIERLCGEKLFEVVA